MKKITLVMTNFPSAIHLGDPPEYRVTVFDWPTATEAMLRPYRQSGDVYVLEFSEGELTLTKYEKTEE